MEVSEKRHDQDDVKLLRGINERHLFVGVACVCIHLQI